MERGARERTRGTWSRRSQAVAMKATQGGVDRGKSHGGGSPAGCRGPTDGAEPKAESQCDKCVQCKLSKH